MERFPYFSSVSKLDHLKTTYDDLGRFLGIVLNQDFKSGRIPNNLKDIELVYMPQLGFLIKIGVQETNVSALDQNSEFEFQFRTDQDVYFKNQRARELDERIGDIQGTIVDLENSICRELSNKVLESCDLLCEAFKKVYDLDW